MVRFKVNIKELDGDIHIYTEATKITMDDTKIEVDYEDKKTIHQMGFLDEITIKANRQEE